MELNRIHASMHDMIGKPHQCVEQLIVSGVVCLVDSYHTRAQLECDTSPHEQDLIQLAIPHMSVVLLLSFITHIWS